MRRRLDKVGLIKSLIQDAKLRIIFGITKDSRRYFGRFNLKQYLCRRFIQPININIQYNA